MTGRGPSPWTCACGTTLSTCECDAVPSRDEQIQALAQGADERRKQPAVPDDLTVLAERASGQGLPSVAVGPSATGANPLITGRALSPEIERLMVVAIRAARWLPDGPLVSGCVHDSGEAVKRAVSEAVSAVRAANAPARSGLA